MEQNSLFFINIFFKLKLNILRTIEMSKDIVCYFLGHMLHT